MLISQILVFLFCTYKYIHGLISLLLYHIGQHEVYPETNQLAVLEDRVSKRPTAEPSSVGKLLLSSSHYYYYLLVIGFYQERNFSV
jgi:hypothetical protein